MELTAVITNNTKVIENLEDKQVSLNNELEINNELSESDNEFLKTKLGQAINNAIDSGLKAVLPDKIEDEIIEIKDSLVEGGIKEAAEKTIEIAIEKGKDIIGSSSNLFKNISEVKQAIDKGGFINGVSEAIDITLDKVEEKGLLSEKVTELIKLGKNIILNDTTKNVNTELDNQEQLVQNIEECCSKWNEALDKQRSFSTLTKYYNKLENELENIISLEEVIKKANEIKNQYELIKSKHKNGEELVLTEEEKELCKKFN